MTEQENPDGSPPSLLIFENDPHQATAYRELFADAGYTAETGLPNQDVQRLCQRLRPAAALPQLVGDLLEQREQGKLKPRMPSTPL